MRNKKVWLTTFFTAALALFGVGTAAIGEVEASATEAVKAETVAFSMDKGAAVRLGTLDGNNGIRFVLKMDRGEYTSLMSQVGTEADDVYSDISFGVIITKASYVSDEKELSVENLFNLNTADDIDNTKFEWKPDGATDDWTVSEGKSLVVNQTFGYLGVAENYENDYVAFASLVQLKDYNLTQEFVGRGYMKYTTKDGTVNYRMADYYENVRTNNVRSMTYVAQKAAEDPEMSDYAETLNSLYISHSAVVAQKVDVTVKHHKKDVHGEEISVTPEILTGKTIGATVTATPLAEEGWIYDETKSTISGVAYANNKTVLDLYYNQDPETAYGAYHVGGVNPVEKTIKLDEVVKGGIIGEEVEVELALDLLEGTMPGIKVWLFVEDLEATNAQITAPSSSYLPVADYYDEATGTYKFRVTFAWNSPNWDIGNVRVALEAGSYRLGVDVVSVKVLSNYDVKINKARETTYNLPEAVTGAVRYDKAIVTLEMIELVGDLTELHIQLKNKAGTTIANNNNAYFTLADCATGEANTYAFELTFPWGNGDWDVTDIVLSVDSNAYIVGVNVKSIEIVPVEYDLKFTANAAHETQTYKLASPIKAFKGDKIEILFTLTNFYGTTNGASTDIYFYLNDALGNVAVTPGWLELTDILVEGNQYKAVANVNASVEIYSIKVQMRYAQKSGLNFDSITLDAVEYDFMLNKEETTTYTLPETVGGMAKYGVADVTLQLVELTGDVTQVKVELLNGNGEVIADNDGEYYTLADCATGTANEYTFSMISFTELIDYDIAAIRLTVDGATYVVGGYYVNITTSAKDYDFVINKTNDYTYTLPEAAAGAVRYDTMLVTVELTELVGDLTKLHLQLKNTAGTVVANNSNKYFTLADCITGEENVYAFALSFPWANGNWDIPEIVFTVGDTAHVVGFNVKSVEIVPVEYDLKFTANTAHETQTYTFATPKSAVAGDKLEIVFTMTNFYGTMNGTSTDVYFHINNSAGTAAANSGWLELTDILVEGSTYKATATIASALEIHSITLQVRYAQKSGVNFNSISLMSESLVAENFDAFIDGNAWTNNTSGVFALATPVVCTAGNTTVTVKLKLSVVASKDVTQALIRVFPQTGNSFCGDSWTKSLTLGTGVHELELTRTFAAGVTLSDICRMELLVYGSGTYTIGIDVVSVVVS
ncbi:MAG: hypothetical protein E7349_02415 [Clostridiales bacterium]|nr:hypothetical protein [Clostridiales bacterium]